MSMTSGNVSLAVIVSLFTREWIEIVPLPFCYIDGQQSPSLRGSGLKLQRFFARSAGQTGLPLYEGVD